MENFIFCAVCLTHVSKLKRDFFENNAFQKRFCEKAISYMFDRVLNTPLHSAKDFLENFHKNVK